MGRACDTHFSVKLRKNERFVNSDRRDSYLILHIGTQKKDIANYKTQRIQHTNTNIMKRIFSAAAICSLILAVSCNKEGSASVDKDFQYVIPTEALVGQSVTFEDQSINVQSREWTFEDGTPATSTKAIVEVAFSKAGEKTVSLTVNYSDGTKDEISKKITIKDEFSAKIKADGLSPKGCAKKGSEITFSLDELKNAAGGNLTYAWSFPGATPATSTDASPKVVWNEQDNNVKVTCEVTRVLDGAKLNLETTLVAGNYPLLVNDEYSAFDFEGATSNLAWYGWFKESTDACLSIADGGAHGTAHSLKIDAKGINALTDSGQAFEVAHRNNWSNNARMVVGQKYEISFWCKAEAATMDAVGLKHNDGELAAIISWVNLFNWIPDWLNDPMRGSAAKTDWSEVFPGETFKEEGAQSPIWAGGVTTMEGTSPDDLKFNDLITRDWKKYSFEFTLENGGQPGDVLKNCYIAFGVTGVNAVFYFDDFQINLVEE